MRSIRIDSACSARQRSSASPVMRLYLMPASGLNSNVVTTGPGIDLRDAAAPRRTPRTSVRWRARTPSARSRPSSRRARRMRSSSVEGSLKLVLPARNFRRRGAFFGAWASSGSWNWITAGPCSARFGSAGFVRRRFFLRRFFSRCRCGGDALLLHGRPPGNLDLLHALAKLFGLRAPRANPSRARSSFRYSLRRTSASSSSPAPCRNEKLVVSRTEVVSSMSDTRFAPTGLNAARNPSAATVPSSPPAGSAPRTPGMWIRDSSAERETSSTTPPTSLVTGASTSWLRNQRIATTNIPTGNRNAEKPQNWKNRSARCAPTGPIQFRAWPAEGSGAETLKEAIVRANTRAGSAPAARPCSGPQTRSSR